MQAITTLERECIRFFTVSWIQAFRKFGLANFRAGRVGIRPSGVVVAEFAWISQIVGFNHRGFALVVERPCASAITAAVLKVGPAVLNDAVIGKVLTKFAEMTVEEAAKTAREEQMPFETGSLFFLCGKDNTASFATDRLLAVPMVSALGTAHFFFEGWREAGEF